MLPRDRVLSEMRRLGLKASELGALGYLGDDPGQIKALLVEFFPWCRGRFRARCPARPQRQGSKPSATPSRRPTSWRGPAAPIS